MKGEVYVTLYIDGNLITGYPEALDEAVELLQKNRLAFEVHG